MFLVPVSDGDHVDACGRERGQSVTRHHDSIPATVMLSPPFANFRELGIVNLIQNNESNMVSEDSSSTVVVTLS
jgi:hypothetical protein